MRMFIAPTTKAVGSEYIIKIEPTALVVGLQKVKAALDNETVMDCHSFK